MEYFRNNDTYDYQLKMDKLWTHNVISHATLHVMLQKLDCTKWHTTSAMCSDGSSHAEIYQVQSKTQLKLFGTSQATSQAMSKGWPHDVMSYFAMLHEASHEKCIVCPHLEDDNDLW